MATLTSSLIVRLLDNVSKPARSITNSIMGIQRAGVSANRVPFGQRLEEGIRRNDAALSRARGGLVDAAAGFFALKAAIGSPIAAAVEFESAMADVTKVVEFDTPEAFQKFRNELIALSKEVPISVNGLAAIAAAAGQAGIAGEELVAFTNAAAKIGVAFDISADEAGTAMAKLMTGLGMTVEEVGLLADAMNHLSNAQASSASEILDVVRRVGAQGKQFGFTATEVSAFASAMIAAGAQSDVAATSFRNMGKALTMGESATKRVSGGLGKLGLDTVKLAKMMQEDAVGTTVMVLEKIAEMPKEMQAALSNDIFGSEARALGPLLTNLDLLKGSLDLVGDQGNFAGSAFREFEVRAKTSENAMQIFGNRLSAIKVIIGASLLPAINDLIEGLSPMLDQFAAFSTANPEIISGIVGTAAAFVGLKASISALTFVGLLGRGGALSMLSVGLKAIGATVIPMRAAAAANVAYTATLAAMAGAGPLSAPQRVSAAIKGMTMAVPGVTALGAAFSALTGVFSAVGASLAAISAPVWAGIGLAVGAVAAAGLAVYQNWDRLAAVFSGVAGAIVEEIGPAFDFLNPVLEALSPLTTGLASSFDAMSGTMISASRGIRAAFSDLSSYLGGFFEREVLTDAQSADIEDRAAAMTRNVIEAVKTAFRSFLEWAASIPAQIIEAIGSIDLANVIKWPEPPEWWNDIFGDEVQGPRQPSPASRTIGGPMISGRRSGGGPVSQGKAYMVGEDGPEIVTFPENGFVHTAQRTARMMMERAPSDGPAFAAPAASPAGIPPGIQITGPLTGAITISTDQDPLALAEEIGEAIETKLGEVMRGFHADGVA